MHAGGGQEQQDRFAQQRHQSGHHDRPLAAQCGPDRLRVHFRRQIAGPLRQAAIEFLDVDLRPHARAGRLRLGRRILQRPGHERRDDRQQRECQHEHQGEQFAAAAIAHQPGDQEAGERAGAHDHGHHQDGRHDGRQRDARPAAGVQADRKCRQTGSHHRHPRIAEAGGDFDEMQDSARDRQQSAAACTGPACSASGTRPTARRSGTPSARPAAA